MPLNLESILEKIIQIVTSDFKINSIGLPLKL